MTAIAPAALPQTIPLSRAGAIGRAVTLPLLLLLAWQLWAFTLPSDTRAPMPARVIASFGQLVADGDLPLAVLMSLGRVLLGFSIGLALGIVLGVPMGAVRGLRNFFEPIVESFRPIAPMAILPIAILFLGTGTPTALSIVAYASFFPLLVNTVHGVSNVDRKFVLAARTMGVSRLKIFTRVILPAALPSILLGSRLAMGSAWTAIIAAELAVGAKAGGGTSGGIGQMMFVFYAYSVDLNGIVVCMIVVGVIALLIDQAFRALESRLLPPGH